MNSGANSFSAGPGPGPRAPSALAELQESPELFGEGRRLMGVITPAVGGKHPPLACLLLNAGVIHRIGPHRINVKLARALAAVGVTSIRFDLSGLGDSRAATSAADFRGQAVTDMQAAMDHLERTRGIRRFMLMGICSGAVNGYWLALADPRVCGLFMFDGFAYRTWKTSWVRLWSLLRVTPPHQLPGKLASRLRRLVARLRPGGEVADVLPDARSAAPSPEEFKRALNSMLARGTSIVAMFSGSAIDSYSYQGQMRDAFPGAEFLKSLRVELVQDIDHTITPLAAQAWLTAEFCRWAEGVALAGASEAPSEISERNATQAPSDGGAR